jgi:hypothetical protein
MTAKQFGKHLLHANIVAEFSRLLKSIKCISQVGVGRVFLRKEQFVAIGCEKKYTKNSLSGKVLY